MKLRLADNIRDTNQARKEVSLASIIPALGVLVAVTGAVSYGLGAFYLQSLIGPTGLGMGAVQPEIDSIILDGFIQLAMLLLYAIPVLGVMIVIQVAKHVLGGPKKPSQNVGSHVLKLRVALQSVPVAAYLLTTGVTSGLVLFLVVAAIGTHRSASARFERVTKGAKDGCCFVYHTKGGAIQGSLLVDGARGMIVLTKDGATILDPAQVQRVTPVAPRAISQARRR